MGRGAQLARAAAVRDRRGQSPACDADPACDRWPVAGFTTNERYNTTGEPRERVPPRLWEHRYPALNGVPGYLWCQTAHAMVAEYVLGLIGWAPVELRPLVVRGLQIT